MAVGCHPVKHTFCSRIASSLVHQAKFKLHAAIGEKQNNKIAKESARLVAENREFDKKKKKKHEKHFAQNHELFELGGFKSSAGSCGAMSK